MTDESIKASIALASNPGDGGARAQDQLSLALQHMAHGLCMFDKNETLTLCNERYREIYGLPPEALQPGVTFRSLLEHGAMRAAHGERSVDEIYAERMAIVRGEAAPMFRQLLANGRTVEVTYSPAPDLSWIATYEDITDQVRAEEALAEKNKLLDIALNNMRQGLALYGADERLITWNEQFRRLYKLDSASLRPGMTLHEVITVVTDAGNQDRRAEPELYNKRVAAVRSGQSSLLRQHLRDGRLIETAIKPLPDGGWVATYDDVTEREAAAHAAGEQNRLFHAALSHMGHGLCMFDEDFNILVVNQRYLDLYRLDPEVIKPGVSLRDAMRHSVEVGNHTDHNWEARYDEHCAQMRVNGSLRVKRRLADGRTISVAHEACPGGGWIATYEDVTEQHEAEARMLYMARHDALTDLPNRTLLHARLGEDLSHPGEGPERIGVICIDLDRFKAVNDTFGHRGGDMLLKEVAERLRAIVPGGSLVARLGGDEFAMLCKAAGRDAIAEIARRIVVGLGVPYQLEMGVAVVGASAGIAVGRDDGDDPELLMERADLALYRAKTECKGGFRFFAGSMAAEVQARNAIERDLREALPAGQFELWYQPQFDARSTELNGYEALLRWRHPERGLVAPGTFIGLAEETGLIVPLGDWAIREACREAAGWPGNTRVAVNVSASQFNGVALERAIVLALGASGLAPHRLELEVTESVLLANTDDTLATLHRLRALGVRIALDDFGTGYSSLSYIRSFPFSKVKIDRSFVQSVAGQDNCVAIVESVATLGARLGIEITAEGVETDDQLRMVQAAGCTEIQGFLLGRPAPAHEARRFLPAAPEMARRA
jgi:diguanylate cyclase (GGDEF)-like protein